MNIDKLHQEIYDIVQDDTKTALVVKLVIKNKKEEEAKRKQKIINGIKAAQDKGVVFGRPKKKIPEQFDIIYEMYEKHRVSSRAAARMLGVAQSTFLKWCNEHECSEVHQYNSIKR